MLYNQTLYEHKIILLQDNATGDAVHPREISSQTCQWKDLKKSKNMKHVF